MWYRLIFFCEENQKLSSNGFTFYGLSTASTTLIPFLFATFITKITSKNKSFDVGDIEDFIKIVESFDTGEIILIIGTRGGANIFEPVEIE